MTTRPTSEPLPLNRTDFIIPLVIMGVFMVIAMQSLEVPSFTIFDELYTRVAVVDLMRGLPPHEHTHPPLTKLIMALFYQLAALTQDHPRLDFNTPFFAWATRLPSVICGTATLGLVYALGRSMFASRWVGAIAAVALACDGMFLVFSRTAMLNIYAVVFSTFATLFTWLAISRRDPRLLALAGLGIGCGLASRLTCAIPAVILTAAVVVFILVSEFGIAPGWAPERSAETAAMPRRPMRWVLWFMASFLLLPAFLYVASHTQYMLAYFRWDARPLIYPQNWVVVIIWLHQLMVQAHASYNFADPQGSMWWTWPLMLRPVWFTFAVGRDASYVQTVWCIGNVALWWAMIPLLAYGVWRGLARRAWPEGLLTLLAAGLWLAWTLSFRATFTHYIFEAVPYLCVLIAAVAVRIFQWATGVLEAPHVDAASRPRVVASLARVATVGYLVAIVAWMGYFYPLLTFREVPAASYTNHMWLGLENWEYLNAEKRYRRENGFLDKKKWDAFHKTFYPTRQSLVHRYQPKHTRKYKAGR